MKVLMLIPSYFPVSSGGAEHAVTNIARRLQDLGIYVEILTLNLTKRWRGVPKTKQTEVSGLSVTYWGCFSPYLILNKLSPNLAAILFGHNVIPLPGLLQFCKKFDVIYFNDEVDLSFELALWRLKTRKKVLHIRTLEQKMKFFRRSPAARMILRSSARVYISDSSSYSKKLRMLGIPAARIKEFPKGVNTNKFEISEGPREDLILFVGRLDDENKGALIFAEAIAKTSYSGSIILMGGEYEQTDYVNAVLKKFGDCTTLKNVEVRGLTSQDDLISLYSKARALVHPALVDSMPNCVLEAMSCGCPVIASETGGLVRLSRDGVIRGFEPGDKQALQKELESIIYDEELLAKLASGARRYIEKYHSYETYISGIIEAITPDAA